MIDSLLSLDSDKVLVLIIMSTISIIIYTHISNLTFKDNVLFLFKKLFILREVQPVLYSYRHISLMVISYFLTILSFLCLNIFYLFLEIYAYSDIEINVSAIEYSELSIKIVIILCATLNISSVLLYYIRNNDNFMKLLKNNYCLLESLLSIILGITYVAAVKYSRPFSVINNDFSDFLIIIIACLVILDLFIQKLQAKKKDSLKKLLFGNSKIKELTNLNRYGDVALIYNVLLCNCIIILLLFYTNILYNISIIKAISYILLECIFIGVTKKYKISINNIIQIKEIN